MERNKKKMKNENKKWGSYFLLPVFSFFRFLVFSFLLVRLPRLSLLPAGLLLLRQLARRPHLLRLRLILLGCSWPSSHAAVRRKHFPFSPPRRLSFGHLRNNNNHNPITATFWLLPRKERTYVNKKQVQSAALMTRNRFRPIHHQHIFVKKNKTFV